MDKVYDEHKTIALPVPLYDGAKNLGEAQGAFVQWPAALVIIEDKV